jgi:hypothetical protein
MYRAGCEHELVANQSYASPQVCRVRGKLVGRSAPEIDDLSNKPLGRGSNRPHERVAGKLSSF